MIAFYEKEYQEQWANFPNDLKSEMINGLVAFEILVTGIQAKKKLSQNKKRNRKKATCPERSNTTIPRPANDQCPCPRCRNGDDNICMDSHNMGEGYVWARGRRVGLRPN